MRRGENKTGTIVSLYTVFPHFFFRVGHGQTSIKFDIVVVMSKTFKVCKQNANAKAIFISRKPMKVAMHENV